MTIAVDFDGTIVEHKYPAIGEEMPFAIESLKRLSADGHQLILWTYRAGRELQAAVDFCQKRGVTFYAINKNFPEETYTSEMSRKIVADIYIDDRNYGGLPDWGVMYAKISGQEIPEIRRRPKSIWCRLFSCFKV